MIRTVIIFITPTFLHALLYELPPPSPGTGTQWADVSIFFFPYEQTSKMTLSDTCLFKGIHTLECGLSPAACF